VHYTRVSVRYGITIPFQQTLTVAEPNTPGPHRAILFVHGGCWGRSGMTSQEIAFAGWLASRTGWVVGWLSYRTTMPRYSHQPADVGAALRRLQTGGFGVDPARVALWGESAGGQLALLTGLKGTGPRGVGRPAAIVSISGPSDMRAQLATPAVQCVTAFEDGLPTSSARRTRYAATSPVLHVDRTDPPTFIASGLFDRHVPVTETMQLDQRLTRAHVVHEVAMAPTGDHATGLEFDTAAGSGVSVAELALNFLRAHI
jgi:acetyl esterase/lipase